MHKNIQKEIASRQKAEAEFQKNLQLTFLKDNGGKFDDIIKALGGGDIVLAHRLAHNLKSNAGQIGETFLQQAAAQVEARLKNGANTAADEQLNTLKEELNIVLKKLAHLLDNSLQPETETLSDPLDAQSVRELIIKLEPMLHMGNPECRKLIDWIRLIPKNSGLKTRLIQQLEDFDFDQAIISLEELKKGWGL